jgi:sugar O-acyltransferase (sialic acid O-acetyltransferase NeuD family)
MTVRLAILGASGHGKVVADTALESGWGSLVFFDDGAFDQGQIGEWPRVGGTADLVASLGDFAGVIVAIGHNRVRLAKTRNLIAAGAPMVTLVHPRAYVARDVQLGAGTVVFAGAVVQPGVVIGSGAIINTGATVDHDCFLADGVHVCPGAHLAGGVAVGECAWLGIGCVVKQFTAVGVDAVVGGAAAVMTPVPDGTTVVGVPARPMMEP